MNRISDAVRTVLFQDDVAFESLRLGYLNLSAYAEQVQPLVEELTWKEVKKSTIVVALSRMAAEVATLPSLRSSLKLDDMTVKSPLCVISYEKTAQHLSHLRQMYKQLNSRPNQFVAVTQGSREITIIVPSELQAEVHSFFGTPPKATLPAMVGISVSFAESYLTVPNVIHTILSALAVCQINVIEIVSTYTELSVIIDQADLELATKALRKFLQ